MQKMLAIALVLMFFSPGCLQSDDETTIEVPSLEETVDELDDIVENSTTVLDEVVREPELIAVPYEEGCDNINPLHVPFPF